MEDQGRAKEALEFFDKIKAGELTLQDRCSNASAAAGAGGGGATGVAAGGAGGGAGAAAA